ncbi:hypothetical protein MMC17_000755 [Xylographa soralifera]|nr:hypothetical protein [Xylographa soralifera]
MPNRIYHENNILHFSLLDPKQTAVTNLEITAPIKAQILRVFQPITNSVVLEVRLLDQNYADPLATRDISRRFSLPQSRSFILKLYDRCAMSDLHEQFDVRPWTVVREEALCDFIKAGNLSAFLSSVGRRLAFLDNCKLVSLQGDCIPTIYAAALLVNDVDPGMVVTVNFSHGDKPFSNLLKVKEILIELINGFQLEDLATCAPESAWPEICEQAIRAVNKVSDLNVTNNNVRPTNMLVAGSSSGENGSWKVAMVDFAMCELRHESKSDKDWKAEKRTLDEEGAIGYVMEMKLKRAKQAGKKKFKATLLTLLSASLSAAYQYLYVSDPSSGLDVLDYPPSLTKREAYAEAYAYAYAEAYADAYAGAYDALPADLWEREVPLSDGAADLQARGGNNDVLGYLRKINTRVVTGSFRQGTWNDLHGDTKSKTDGAYHIQRMMKQGRYHARILTYKGALVAETEVPVQNGRAPWTGCAVHFLRVKLGGARGPC